MRNIWTFFFLFLLLCSKAQESKPLSVGTEILSYSAHYHWGLFWMEAGEVVFKIDTLQSQSNRFLEMSSIGKSLPKYDWLYKVRDTFESRTGNLDLKPIFYRRANYEGKGWTRNKYRFNRKTNFIIRDMESSENHLKIDTIPYESEFLMDVLSAVYEARMWNLQKANPKDRKVLDLIISGNVYKITLTFEGEETIRHKNGKKYLCYLVTTEVVEGLIFKANQTIQIFVSKDENRIPLLVKAPILVGRVEAYLKEVQGVPFPYPIQD